MFSNVVWRGGARIAYRDETHPVAEGTTVSKKICYKVRSKYKLVTLPYDIFMRFSNIGYLLVL